MAVNLSALAGAGQQFFDNNGVILSGGKLYSYAAGTTTPQTAYTSASGATPLSNPIILDSAGRIATGEIWITAGSNYKFVLKTSTDTILATWDNITGINGTGITTNASSVQYDPAGTGAIATTVQDKLRQTVSVKDFGAVGDGTTDDTAAIQNAIATQKSVYFPKGTYKITSLLTLSTSGQILYSDFKSTTLSFVYTSSGNAITIQAFDVGIFNFTIQANDNVVKILNFIAGSQRCLINNCVIQNASSTVVTNQIGIYADGNSPASYFNKVTNCSFNYLYVGIELVGIYGNGWFINNCNFSAGNICIWLNNSIFNTISDCFFQTPTVAGIKITKTGSGGAFNNIATINGESNTCPIILIDSGVSFNSISNVWNSGSYAIVTDNAAGPSGAPGVNNIRTGQNGQITAPALTTSQTYNTFGTQIQVIISVGATSTNLTKNAVFLSTLINSSLSIMLQPGEFTNISQTANVSWTWWRV